MSRENRGEERLVAIVQYIIVTLLSDMVEQSLRSIWNMSTTSVLIDHIDFEEDRRVDGVKAEG